MSKILLLCRESNTYYIAAQLYIHYSTKTYVIEVKAATAI